MPVTKVVMYRVSCDAEDCRSSLGMDYEMLFESSQEALSDAADYEWDTAGEQVLCPRHARLTCHGCGAHADLVADHDDDLLCPACRSSAVPSAQPKGA